MRAFGWDENLASRRDTMSVGQLTDGQLLFFGRKATYLYNLIICNTCIFSKAAP
jgi:hypothetical protein